MKLSLLKPEGTRRVGILKLRWRESGEEDLKNMGVRNWRRKSQDRDQWRRTLEESQFHHGLYCQKKKKKELRVTW